MKIRSWAFLLLVSIVLIACSQVPAVPTTPPLDFASIMERGVIYADPVFTNGVEDNAWDTGLIDSGSVIAHNGELHMFYNGIPLWASPVAVGYATSADGVEWTRMSDDPVFSIQDVVSLFQ